MKQRAKRWWRKWVSSAGWPLNIVFLVTLGVIILHDFVFWGWPELFPAASRLWELAYLLALTWVVSYMLAIDFVDGVEGAGVAITRTNAARAYVWCEYLRSHAVRIYSPMLDTPERRAEVLLKRIHRGDVEDGTKTRDIWRRGWSRLGTAADLAEATAVLEGLGWARREEVKPNDGGRPSEILRLHPKLRE